MTIGLPCGQSKTFKSFMFETRYSISLLVSIVLPFIADLHAHYAKISFIGEILSSSLSLIASKKTGKNFERLIFDAIAGTAEIE